MLKTASKTLTSSSINDAITLLTSGDKLSSVKKLLAPHTKRAYLVGGCVRDSLLAREVYDYDIEVYDINPKRFDEIMQSVGASGVGKSYFIYKFGAFDLGLPRTESKTGKLHTDFKVSYCNDEREASKRRDFSVNAMMINIFSGEILDFWAGKQCLKDGILRHIDDEKFCEDALRVLRGVQFASRLNFDIANATLRLMKSIDLSHLSKTRISNELIKFMRAKYLEKGVFYLYKLGLFKKFFGLNLDKNELEELINELKNARNFIQDERVFLYVLAGFCGVDIKNIVHDLALPNSFLSALKHPFYNKMPSDFEMMKISLDMPLSKWLGCYRLERIKRAKELGVYDEKFTPNINTSEIMSLGFKGKEFGAELNRRQDEAILLYLQSLKKCD
ncbi:CCA-adding enzyme [Campylobacter suis]|uniref:CCA-adding enzyme n=1 Tax=Campylobacter suis TaxID=2790657 RepID=A0ABN7K4B1_9BACT|nr:CCA tRNA nucleotidyltransferase [Campylobacter suis]CAD7286724.1 CCA-adding enzyme [Campylobacter suis]